MIPKTVTWRQFKHHQEILVLILPTAALIALFQYYPALSGIYHSFFRWNGADISEYVGLRNYGDLFRSSEFWNSFGVALLLGGWTIAKMIPSLLIAVCIHRVRSERLQYLYRALFVVPMVIPSLVTALIWRSFFFEATSGYLNRFLDITGLFGLLCRLDRWFHLGGVFTLGVRPAWLGDPRLIITSMVLWAFPWVGTFGVLAHLAKLQAIPKSWYEAAEMEGVTWWTKFTKIELPTLTGSIYILLVLAIIDTFRDASTVFALAGFEGGPGGRATVPALFMLRKAFMSQDMGAACAIGLILAVVVVGLQKAGTAAMEWEQRPRWHRTAVRAFAVLLGLVLLAAGRFAPVALALLVAGAPWPFLLARLPAPARSRVDRILERFRARPSVPVRAAAGAGPRRPYVEPPSTPERPWTAPALVAAKHGFIWLVLALALLPLYLMFIVSLKSNAQFYEHPATLTAPLHWENFSAAWRIVTPTLANSLFIAITSTLFTVWLGLWAAYFFARVHMPLTGVLWNAVLVLMTLPTVANLVPTFRLLGDLTLLNTLTGLIVVGVSAGQVFAMFVLRNFIADIPQELFDAAEVDGATHFEQVRLIVAPQAGAILGTVGVLHFVGVWNDFVMPLIVMRDHARLPVMVELLRMSGEYIKFWGPLMAGYALASVPVVVLFLFTMKLYMRGLTEGIH